MYEKYFGLIELGFTVIAFTAFYIWQTRSLKHDIAEREKREAEQAKLEKEDD